MRILLQNRHEDEWLGGDMVQLRATQAALLRRGIQADYSYYEDAPLHGYGLVHLFHLNYPWCKPMAYNAMRIGLPLVVTAIFYPGENMGLRNSEMRTICRYASRIICFSCEEKAELLEQITTRLEPKVRLIPNGVDTEIFRPDGPRVAHEPFVLSVGRVEKLKGYVELAAACRNLGLPLVWIGPKSKSETEPQLDFEWHDAMPQEELAKWYRTAGLYVCASHSERMNLCLLEAAACGARLISSVHNRGNCWLPGMTTVDPADAEALKMTVAAEWYGPQKNGKFARTVAEELTWDQVAGNLETIYREVLDGTGCNLS